MRIIGGKFKGIKLFDPLNTETRPLKDITKESIFNVLDHFKWFPFKLKNTSVLDLFSGSGSFGLECLSRDAKKVTFVENNRNTIKILKKNIGKFNLEKKSTIFEYSVFDYLLKVDNFDFKVDLIFLDPPYKEKDIFELINNVIKKNILKNNGIIIIHRNKKSKDIFPNDFKVLSIKKYGISKIIFGNLAF